MSEKPFFSANLIVTNSSGEYYGIRSYIYLIATPEFVQIGQSIVTYDKLIDMSCRGSLLFVQFVDETGKSREYYLRYNTFLPTTAPKRLRALVRTATALIPPKVPKADGSGRLLATAGQANGARNEVTVYSSRVSFPPRCPVCFVPASRVAKFEVTSVIPSSDLMKFGYWLIPVCNSHKDLNGQLQVKNWSPKSSELGFVFKDQKYAEAFLALNSAPLESRTPTEPIVLEKIGKLRNLKFVLYQYYVSAIFFGFLGSSDVHALRKDQSQFIKGLKYNAITLTAGWWSFPFGPVFTVLVLIRNFMGGTDVSDRVVSVFAGRPFSASGD